MTIEQFRNALRQTPFRAFRIRMADGRAFDVMHPDFVSMSPTGRTIVVHHASDESFSVLDLLLMSEIEMLPPASAESR
jgi:hypothetical protein